jgi:replicative DNA helicase
MSDPELALLGHLIGDGSTPPSRAMRYTTPEPELASLVADLAERVFGDAIRTHVHHVGSSYQVYLSDAARRVNGARSPAASWLDVAGVFDPGSLEKRVPDAVFRQPPEAIAVFLRHLWAAAGTLRYAGVSAVIRFDSSSEALTRGIQSLLLRLGITARRREVPMPGRDGTSHRLDVSGQGDAFRFLLRVGAVGRRRLRIKDEILDCLLCSHADANRDVSPRLAWRTIVVPSMATAGVATNVPQAEAGTAYDGPARHGAGTSQTRAERVAEIVDSDELEALSTSDVHWDEVLSIEPDGKEEVYDLTVEGLHNFVAEDIVVHNSLEQDSDLVFFVYRDEYYLGEESDQQGIAEVILAKHRNGPTGTVKLSFLRRYAKFADLAAA